MNDDGNISITSTYNGNVYIVKAPNTSYKWLHIHGSNVINGVIIP
jgi:hypothetical protein